MHAFDFYATCTLGGVLSCGLTHTGITPLDNIKCNMQGRLIRQSIRVCGFNKLLNKHGMGALFRGWVPTFLGYSIQGAVKFGFYEFFKVFYSDIVGTQNAQEHKTLIYLAGSASAEFIAGIALCPFEAIKVRMQTSPDLAKGSLQAFSQILASGGCNGLYKSNVLELYKGLVPLWGRQIPYTMVKFACFEKTVESIYKYAIPIPKEECPKAVQLGVSFVAGYIAGISCALVSHPADNLVSVLNGCKATTVRAAIRKLGVVALFTRGLPLRILMVGTLTGAQWAIYDSFRVYTGLPTSGTMLSKCDDSNLNQAYDDS